MKVFRLSRKKYANDLSGKGAALFGYRWNSKGIEMVYTAESRALAMAEVAVHLTLATLPEDYMMIEIEIPGTVAIEEIDINDLSSGWNTYPHMLETQLLGDSFARSMKACVLKVPSAVVKGDFNYLLNPNHPAINKIKIVNTSRFPFDRRIFK